MPTDQELKTYLTMTLADGFNRSLAALRRAQALDGSNLDREYRGVGSRYYDLVTDQIEQTAALATPGLRALFETRADK